MPEDFDLLDDGVIRTILSETTKSEDKDRRRQSYNAYQVYSGNQKVYIERELARTRPKSFQSYTISNISVSKMVIDKRAQVYNENPIRSVDGIGPKTENLEQVYREANALRELQFHDTVFNLNKYDLIWVNYRDNDQAYQFITLQPYEFVLVRDKDTGELLVVGLNYPTVEMTQDAKSSSNSNTISGGDGISDLIAENQSDSAAQGETWVFWSKTQHVKVKTTSVTEEVNGISVLKKNVDFIPIDGNPGNVNPLEMIPFVLTTSDTAIDYPTVNPITEQSITFNSQQSETLTAKNIHGTGIQVFKYPEKFQGRFNKMSQGQTQAIELPQSSNPDDAATDFEYKTSGAQLGPMLESDMNYLKQILREHEIEGVNMDLGENGNISGISRAIAGSSVQKVIERNQQTYTQTEKKMFDIIKAWDRFNGTRLFSEEDELQIVFPKPKILASDRETLDNIKMMLELGVIEEWEKFVKMDPNLTETEAIEKLERIESRKMDNAQQLLSRGMNGNQQEESNEDSESESKGFKLPGESRS